MLGALLVVSASEHGSFICGKFWCLNYRDPAPGGCGTRIA